MAKIYDPTQNKRATDKDITPMALHNRLVVVEATMNANSIEMAEARKWRDSMTMWCASTEKSINAMNQNTQVTAEFTEVARDILAALRTARWLSKALKWFAGIAIAIAAIWASIKKF